MYHANVNVHFMEENVIQISCGIATNPDVSGKNMCEKNYIWNPTTCSYKNENIQQVSLTIQ